LSFSEVLGPDASTTWKETEVEFLGRAATSIRVFKRSEAKDDAVMTRAKCRVMAAGACKLPLHRYLRKVDVAVAVISWRPQKAPHASEHADTIHGACNHPNAFTRCFSCHSSQTERGCISNQSPLMSLFSVRTCSRVRTGRWLRGSTPLSPQKKALGQEPL
jgi:hypothetical protein